MPLGNDKHHLLSNSIRSGTFVIVNLHIYRTQIVYWIDLNVKSFCIFHGDRVRLFMLNLFLMDLASLHLNNLQSQVFGMFLLFMLLNYGLCICHVAYDAFGKGVTFLWFVSVIVFDLFKIYFNIKLEFQTIKCNL